MNHPGSDPFRTADCDERNRRVSFRRCRLPAVVFLIVTLAFACGNKGPKTPPPPDASPAPLPIASADSQASAFEEQERIKRIAFEVVQTLKRKDMERLAQFAYPDKGVRFSSSSSTDLIRDLRFSPNEVRSLLQDTTALIWGTADGTGDPIRLSFNSYYERYVYDTDFANADSVAMDRFISQSNTVNNLEESYPDAVILEYYREGTNPSYEGMDWSSLYLILERIGTSWYLTGIAHNRWTI